MCLQVQLSSLSFFISISPSFFISSSRLLPGLVFILATVCSPLSPWAHAAGRPWHCWAVSLQSAAWGCWEWQSAPTIGCTWRRASLCLWTRALTSRHRCTQDCGESASWLVSNKTLGVVQKCCIVTFLCTSTVNRQLTKSKSGNDYRMLILKALTCTELHLKVASTGSWCCHTDVASLHPPVTITSSGCKCAIR